MDSFFDSINSGFWNWNLITRNRDEPVAEYFFQMRQPHLWDLFAQKARAGQIQREEEKKSWKYNSRVFKTPNIKAQKVSTRRGLSH